MMCLPSCVGVNLVLICYMLWLNIWWMESLDSLLEIRIQVLWIPIHMLTIAITQLADDVIALSCCWSQYVLAFMGYWLNLLMWESLGFFVDNLISLEAHEICDPTRPPLSCFVRVCGRLLVHAAGATFVSHMLWGASWCSDVGLCGDLQ